MLTTLSAKVPFWNQALVNGAADDLYLIASLYLFDERAHANYSFPTSSMASVVGMAFQDCKCPVDLLQQNDAGQFVR